MPSDRPLAGDPSVQEARKEALSRSKPGVLYNSMSDGTYLYRPLTQYNSLREPDYYLANSMSDSLYQLPHALRASSLTTRRPQVGVWVGMGGGEGVHVGGGEPSSAHMVGGL